MSIGEALLNASLRDPGGIAVIDGRQRWTYAELNAKSNRAAHAFIQANIRAEDRVVVCSRNRVEVLAAYFALQKIGACYTPVNPRLTGEELRRCLELAEYRAVLFEARDAATVEQIYTTQPDATYIAFADLGEDAPEWATRFDSFLSDTADSEPPDIPADNALSVLFFTSGTTGRPKGVPRTHHNEVAATLFNLVAFPWRLGERLLGVMPLYHTMGIRTLLSSVFLGGLFVIQREWHAGEALQLIDDHRLTSTFLVPTMYHDMLVHSAFDPTRIDSLATLGYAGMTMDFGLHTEILERMRPRRLVNVYGSSEIYCFSYCDYTERKRNSVGKPPFQQRLRVVRPDPLGRVSPDDEMPVGEHGEIICSASSTDAFSGYWRNPSATRRALRDGWYFTGDLGYRDEDGDFYVLGRVDDTIITGGENVHPLEVENVLTQCPGIAEVAVAGLPDKRLGQIVTAFVVRKDPTLIETQVQEFLRSSRQLASFKRPQRIEFVEGIPKSAVGKVLRRLLSEDPRYVREAKQ